MIIRNAEIYRENHRFEPGDLIIRGGRIRSGSSSIFPESGEEIIDASGLLAIPGLVDIHLHGAMGQDFSEGSPEGLIRIARYEAEHGVLAVCPAAMTLPEEKLEKVMDSAASFRYLQETGESEPAADLVGIRLEGPFLNREKAGAQDPRYILPPDPDLFLRLQARCGGLIRICDLAPEEPGALEFIQEMKDRVRISLAHTTADYETAKTAFSLGAKQLTHLFNAMPGISHRSPGPIAAAADCSADAELISDGVHIHPAVVRLAFRIFGPEHIILISDSMEGTGLSDGTYRLGGQDVCVSGPRAVLSAHPEVIAGSVTNLYDCMKTAVKKCGIPLEQAVRAASENPARAIGLERDYGSLQPGVFGNLILIDRALTPVLIIKKGQIIWQRGSC